MQRVDCTRDFFVLFAEAQRAVGTRVFFDVVYGDCPHAVLFVSPSEFCVMSDDATLMLRVQLCDVTSATVNTGGCVTVVCGELQHSLQASAAAAVCDALNGRVAPVPVAVVSREVAVLELRTRWFSLLTADWRARVRTALAAHPLFSLSKHFTVSRTRSSCICLLQKKANF